METAGGNRGMAGDVSFNREPQLEGLTEKEVKELYAVLKRFLEAYREKDPESSGKEWLEGCYRRELPEWEEEKIKKLAEETLSGIEEYDRNLNSAREAAKKGISSEKWLERQVKEASIGLSVNEMGNYLSRVDAALEMGNTQMMRAVTTQSGEVSQCMNLDGFIAEQHHVNTFNANAALKGSKYEARVQVPEPGQAYGRNSFDTVIVDKATGKIVQQYQVKYGATAQETIKLLKGGDYHNQRILVPPDQVAKVQAAFPNKTVTATMGSEELGVFSSHLTKEQAKGLQVKAQDAGIVERLWYHEFETRDLVMHIGKNAVQMGVQSAVISTGFVLAANALNGEDIDPDALVETAFTTGADAGVKAAATGALKVCTEKGMIAIIPPGTPVHWIANIACVGIEDAKILAKVAAGELTIAEGLDQMGRTSTSLVCGLGWGGAGMAVGAAALSWVPIAGPVLGGVVGGLAGYMAGSSIGEAVYEGVKTVGSVVVSAAKRGWEAAKSVGSAVGNGIRSFAGGVASFFGW